MAVSSPLPHNNFKQCHQASAPGGLWVRWKQVEGLCQSWGSCQTDQDRQTQSSVEALCSAPSKTRAQGRRPVIQTMCGASLWAREVVGRARKNGTKLPSYFQMAFFLIQHSHGCCKTLLSGIMTVDSYSFCLFFLLFFFSWGQGEFGAVHATIFNQVTSFAFTINPQISQGFYWMQWILSPVPRT